MRKEQHYEIIADQPDELIQKFLDKKKEKNTYLEESYLNYEDQENFNKAYLSISNGRKVFFTIPEIIKLMKQYDEIERNSEDLFADLEEIYKEFKNSCDKFFTELDKDRKPMPRFLGRRRRRLFLMENGFYAGSFFADEIRKFLTIMINSENENSMYWAYQMLIVLQKYRYKAAFKVYEKIAKNITKKAQIEEKSFREFYIHYENIRPKLKKHHDLKILKTFGANLRKLTNSEESMRVFEAMFKD